jgi:sulfate adenylyltransferase subunit 2
MKNLKKLEDKSIFIIREAYYNFSNLAMLWSIGKDSSVLIRLCQKAFFGHIPIPLIHIDTGFKMKQMIDFRDDLAIKQNLNMIVVKNDKALHAKETFPDKNLSCIECCKNLKTKPLRNAINGKTKRYKLNHSMRKYEVDNDNEPYDGLILGIRADEEGSRSKERYFSPRTNKNNWEITTQPPEFWQQYNTHFPRNTHVRIHPLLDWTEVDVWQYIMQEKIPLVDLYFDKGQGQRYRSLGCEPCTKKINSSAKNIKEIIHELLSGKLKNVAERDGRGQDKEDGGGLENLRQEGYM